MPREATRYAVVAVEKDVTDFTAIFDDQSQAEEYADKLDGDPDFDGTDYAVVPVTVDLDAVRGLGEEYHG